MTKELKKIHIFVTQTLLELRGDDTEAENVPVREDDGHGQSVQEGFTTTVDIVQSLDVHHFLL